MLKHKNMISKIIHYCWFGGNPLPPLALECIASWRKYFPDYEIWQWGEDDNVNDNENVNDGNLFDKKMAFDVNIIPYTAEAYAQKKYAFVSDYARFWILYKYGGIYFDTDVEVIKPMDDIVERGAFMGCETDYKGGLVSRESATNPGLGLGVAPGLGLIKKMCDYYDDKHFEFKEGGKGQETVVHIATRILYENGMQNIGGIQCVDGVWIYPSEYFCPINITTKRLHTTENTRSIHRYMDSWGGQKKSWKDYVRKYIPESFLLKYNIIKSRVGR